MVAVAGFVAAGLEGVRRQFETNFAERGEVGASVCALVDGEVVVDLWGGWADPGSRRPWQRDTLVDFYSAGKPLLACTLLQLVDAGRAGLEDRVASIWPAFAAGGKERATLRHALSHQAGVPAIGPALTDEDLWSWDTMVGAVAATPAWFEPGSRLVYHTNTFGHLVGEIARRLSGELPGTLLGRIAGEVHADVHFGLADHDLGRCATVLLDAAPPLAGGGGEHPEAAMVQRGYFNPPGYSSFGVVNSTRWRRAQIPSTNGHGTAAGLAAVYDALLTPGRVLSAALTAEATRAQAEGPCPVLGEWAVFGLGFAPTSPRRPFGPSPGAFGHFGTGGAVGFADPARRVAFGYVMNHVVPRWQSSRNRALIGALYDAL